MQNGTRIPKTRPALILLLAVILAAVAALSLHTGSATYAQTAAVSTPEAPQLTARDAGANTIELSWTEVPGADRYELHRQEVDAPGWQQIDSGALRDTSFTDRELTAGVTYQYALRAIDGNGEPLGPWSNFPKETVSLSGASTPTPTSTPAPTSTPTVTPAQTATATASAVTAPRLSARDAGANAIELSWTEVPGADRYALFRQEVAAPGWQQIDGGALRDTSFTDRGLTAGVTYQYALRAIDGNGEPLGPWSNFPKETASGSGASTPAPTSTVTSTPTVTPAQTATATATASTVTAPRLSARDAGANAIELSWTEVPGADRYALFRQEVAAPGWQQIDGGNLRDTSFRDGGLTAGVTYQYAVRGIDGNGEPLGPWSNFPTETASGSGASTPTPTPTPGSTQTATASTVTAPRLSARSAGADAIELSWTEVPGAVRYALFRQDVDDPGWQQIDGGALRGTSFTDRGLTAGVTYQYAVRGIDGNGQPLGPWSNFPEETVFGSGAPTPATTDRGALIALYEATGGAGWPRNGNWLSDKPLDSWDGVTTDANGRVTALRAAKNYVSGRLPDLSALTELNYLFFNSNYLRGPIPDLSAFTKLKYLFFNNNSLRGPIPDLSAFTALQRMKLSNNELSGPVPELSALANLTLLDFRDNRLSGEIPELSALANLTLLDLGYNQLHGEIPELSALTSLTHLSLDYNNLSEGIPDMSTLSSLRILDLSGNQLSGEIPDLSALTSLTRLVLQYNQLSGEIPDLSALTSLTRLDLSNNQLSGEIPDLSALTSLTRLDLGRNQLSGPVPDLSGLTALTGLDLGGNRFCLPAGASLSHPNSSVDAHLKRLNLPACTDADLSSLPDVPQNLKATVGSGEVTLTWDAVTNAAGYDLRTWDSINREWGAIGGALTATTIYTHTVQTDGRNYYYQVRSRDADNVRSVWSERVQAIVAPGPFPPPPPSLGLDIIYQKYFEFGGVHVAAPSEVSDEKMALAQAIVTGMLSSNLDLFAAAPANKMRMAIFKENEAGERLIQLPEFRDIEQDTGGLMVWTLNGWVVGGAPETDWRCGTFIHEFAHVIWFGVESLHEVDQPGGQSFIQRVTAQYEAAIEAGLWQDDYASWNVREYWAETVRYWFQGKVPDFLVESPSKLEDYDPEIARLIAEVFGDASVPAACQVPLSERQA